MASGGHDFDILLWALPSDAPSKQKTIESDFGDEDDVCIYVYMCVCVVLCCVVLLWVVFVLCLLCHVVLCCV